MQVEVKLRAKNLEVGKLQNAYEAMVGNYGQESNIAPDIQAKLAQAKAEGQNSVPTPEKRRQVEGALSRCEKSLAKRTKNTSYCRQMLQDGKKVS